MKLYIISRYSLFAAPSVLFNPPAFIFGGGYRTRGIGIKICKDFLGGIYIYIYPPFSDSYTSPSSYGGLSSGSSSSKVFDFSAISVNTAAADSTPRAHRVRLACSLYKSIAN